MSKHPEQIDRLDACIETLYTVFAPYRLEADFEERCSPLGDRRAMARRLMMQPLRSCPLELCCYYTFKATLTMGDERDFKHFLPRLFELMGTDPQWYGYDTRIFTRLREIDWQKGSEQERSAITQFVLSHWRQIIASWPWLEPAHYILAEIAEAFDDISPFLQIWTATNSQSALRHLAEAVSDAGWERKNDQFSAWLFSEDNKAKLERAFFESADQECAAEFARAVDYFA